jgi:hypothetical protein
MALSKSVLKGLILSEYTAQGYVITPESTSLATAIANAVVNHIVAAAELLPTSTDSGTAGAGMITGKVI